MSLFDSIPVDRVLDASWLGSPLKPGVGQYIAIHATLTARDFSSLLISTLPVHSPAFFPKPFPIFPVLAVVNTWLLCSPAE